MRWMRSLMPPPPETRWYFSRERMLACSGSRFLRELVEECELALHVAPVDLFACVVPLDQVGEPVGVQLEMFDASIELASDGHTKASRS